MKLLLACILFTFVVFPVTAQTEAEPYSCFASRLEDEGTEITQLMAQMIKETEQERILSGKCSRWFTVVIYDEERDSYVAIHTLIYNAGELLRNHMMIVDPSKDDMRNKLTLWYINTLVVATDRATVWRDSPDESSNK